MQKKNAKIIPALLDLDTRCSQLESCTPASMFVSYRNQGYEKDFFLVFTSKSKCSSTGFY